MSESAAPRPNRLSDIEESPVEWDDLEKEVKAMALAKGMKILAEQGHPPFDTRLITEALAPAHLKLIAEHVDLSDQDVEIKSGNNTTTKPNNENDTNLKDNRIFIIGSIVSTIFSLMSFGMYLNDSISVTSASVLVPLFLILAISMGKTWYDLEYGGQLWG